MIVSPPGGQTQPPEETGQERTLVTPGKIVGDVCEWDEIGGVGWIVPHSAVRHPLAAQNDGKLRVDKKDLLEMPFLFPGQLVRFAVYADAHGLSVAEVVSF